MDIQRIFEKIDELSEEYVKVWADISEIESPTAYKEGVDSVCDYLLELAAGKGWEIDVLHHDTAGKAACITMNPDAQKAPVCLSAHMDTVHPVGSFGPAPVRIENGMIYGPGVCDCKGGIVSSLLCMAALSDLGFNDRPVKLILQSDEETGSKTSGKETVRFMCEKAKGAAAFINGEGCLVKKKWTVAISRKGILRYKFNVKGVAVHSSSCYDGANAVCEAAHKIIELEKMKDPDGITCNCGVIEGGTVANSVAAECSFLADFRFATKAQMSEVESLVQKIADTVYVKGCSCIAQKISDRPPMEKTEKNIALLEKINIICEAAGLAPVGCETRNGGSDAAYITQAGIPCIDNLGIAGGGIHSVNEYAEIASLPEAAKYMAAIITMI